MKELKVVIICNSTTFLIHYTGIVRKNQEEHAFINLNKPEGLLLKKFGNLEFGSIYRPYEERKKSMIKKKEQKA